MGAEHPYGHHHRAVRKRFEPKVRAGKVNCWRCGRRIAPGAKWDLGHVDAPEARRQFGPRHPEHLACNRATARIWKERATQAATTPAEPASTPSREW